MSQCPNPISGVVMYTNRAFRAVKYALFIKASLFQSVLNKGIHMIHTSVLVNNSSIFYPPYPSSKTSIACLEPGKISPYVPYLVLITYVALTVCDLGHDVRTCTCTMYMHMYMYMYIVYIHVHSVTELRPILWHFPDASLSISLGQIVLRLLSLLRL